jgi:metal-dependent amidase/aminoacylase/carboxypeptidase family protein
MGSLEEILAGYDGLQAGQEAFYQDLHRHPELSHQEHRTAGRVAGKLQECGAAVQTGIGGTGVAGVLANGAGPTVLLRAELDALPVREDTGADYASTATSKDAQGHEVPVAHACGHVIPDHALLELNLRSYSDQTHERMLASVQRIVRAESHASGSPRDPDFDTIGSFPLTVNEPATPDRVASAFAAHFRRPRR